MGVVGEALLLTPLERGTCRRLALLLLAGQASLTCQTEGGGSHYQLEGGTMQDVMQLAGGREGKEGEGGMCEEGTGEK